MKALPIASVFFFIAVIHADDPPMPFTGKVVSIADGDTVETDDRDILGHAASLGAQFSQGADRHQIVDANQRGQRRVAFQQ